MLLNPQVWVDVASHFKSNLNVFFQKMFDNVSLSWAYWRYELQFNMVALESISQDEELNSRTS